VIEGVLLDVDGTVLDGGGAIAGADAAIDWIRGRGLALLFATNISRKPRSQVAGALRGAGLDAADAEILSASAAAAAHLAEEGVRRVHPLLAPSALEDFAAFEITHEGAEAVVVGDMGNLFTYDVLNLAFHDLRRGAKLVACQKNRFWKGDDGVRMDAGGFVAALAYAAGVTAEVVGKPAPGFFRAAARITGRPLARLAIVGDSLDADVAGGRAAGLTTILVRTGLYDEKRLRETPPRERPDHVIDSVRDLPRLLETLAAR
jgi:HAD superfamily hydrolase (TIGR01458 family)